jgi:alkylmercury lyase
VGAGPIGAGSGAGDLATAFARAFPPLTPADQQLALTLYRLLARGRAVAHAPLGVAAGRAATEVDRTLAAWPGLMRDEGGAVVGFLGLSVNETAHRFEVDGVPLYTWCAWDALFLPQLLNASARVTSACPATGAPVHLIVAPHGVASVHPPEVVVSFLLPDEAELRRHTTASFCHFVHFFASPEAARDWITRHPGAWLLTLDEAFALGRAVNEARYPDALAPAGP